MKKIGTLLAGLTGMNTIQTLIAAAAICSIVSAEAPAQRQWVMAGSMPYAISRSEAVAHDSDVFVLGGYSDSLNGVPFIQRFRPGAGFEIAGGFRPRLDFVAGVDSDGIYCLGGSPPFAGGNPREDPIMDRIRFDSLGDGREFDADSAFRRIGSTGLVYKGIFYLFGGVSREPVPFVLEYNLRTHERRAYGDRKLINGQMCARIGDDIYIFGGANVGILRTIVRYNTNTHAISILPLLLSQPRAFGRAIHIEGTDSIMIIGGTDETDRALPTTEIFRVAPGQAPSVHPGPRLRIARSHFSAAFHQGWIYVFGGQDRTALLSSVEAYSTLTGVTDAGNPFVASPAEYRLAQNFPNPFNPATQIGFFAPNSGFLSIAIYSLIGQRVITLHDGIITPGDHSITWNGETERGSPAPSGVYFCRMTRPEGTQTIKMLLAR